MGQILEPDEWLIQFLEANISYNNQPVPVFSLTELDVEKITLPSIIITETIEATADTFQGSWREALGFIAEIKADRASIAKDIRKQAIELLDDEVLTENFVFGEPTVSFIEILELDQLGDTPVFNAGFQVSVRY